MRYAVVVEAVIVNIIRWDGEVPYSTDDELFPLEEGSPVGIGWIRVGDEWVAPPAPDYPEEEP